MILTSIFVHVFNANFGILYRENILGRSESKNLKKSDSRTRMESHGQDRTASLSFCKFYFRIAPWHQDPQRDRQQYVNFGSQEIDVSELQTYHPFSSSVNRIGQTGQRWVYRKPVNDFRNSIPVIRDRSIVAELPWILQTKVIF